MKHLIIALISAISNSMPVIYKPNPREVWRPKEFKTWNDPQFDVKIISRCGNSVTFMFTNKRIAQTTSTENVKDFTRTYDRLKLAGIECILQRRHSKMSGSTTVLN